MFRFFFRLFAIFLLYLSILLLYLLVYNFPSIIAYLFVFLPYFSLSVCLRIFSFLCLSVVRIIRSRAHAVRFRVSHPPLPYRQLMRRLSVWRGSVAVTLSVAFWLLFPSKVTFRRNGFFFLNFLLLRVGVGY